MRFGRTARSLPALPIVAAKALLEDPDWPLPEGLRRQISAALATAGLPNGLIELRHEIQGYRDFCRYRNRLAQRRQGSRGAARGVLLEARRKRIRARIQARRFLRAQRLS